MEFEKIIELLREVSESQLTEFEYEKGETKLYMRKNHENEPLSCGMSNGDADMYTQQSQSVPQKMNVDFTTQTQYKKMANEAGSAEKDNTEDTTGYIKSPLVGTFYTAPSEGAAPFVQVGDHVEKGQVVAIVEAMKLMNEIESDVSGVIRRVLVENGAAVEYGQALFEIA